MEAVNTLINKIQETLFSTLSESNGNRFGNYNPCVDDALKKLKYLEEIKGYLQDNLIGNMICKVDNAISYTENKEIPQIATNVELFYQLRDLLFPLRNYEQEMRTWSSHINSIGSQPVVSNNDEEDDSNGEDDDSDDDDYDTDGEDATEPKHFGRLTCLDLPTLKKVAPEMKTSLSKDIINYMFWNALTDILPQKSREYQTEYIRIFVDLGVNLEGQDPNGVHTTPIGCAIDDEINDLNLIHSLVACGANVNGDDEHEYSYVGYACRYNYKNCIRIIDALVQHGYRITSGTIEFCGKNYCGRNDVVHHLKKIYKHQDNNSDNDLSDDSDSDE